MADQIREATLATFPGARRSLSQPKVLSVPLFIPAGPPPATPRSATALGVIPAASAVCAAAAIGTAATAPGGAEPGPGDGF